MDKMKKVKGSAVYLEDGGLIFTPYNSSPQNSPWKQVLPVQHGALRISDEVVQIRLSVKKGKSSYRDLMNDFSELMILLQKHIK